MQTQSYVGMSDDEISRTWKARFAGEYKPHELDAVDRKWRRMGKLIAQNRRTEPKRKR